MKTMKKRLWRDFLILVVLFLGAWIFFIYNPVVDSEVVKETYTDKEKELKDKLVDLLEFKIADGDTYSVVAFIR